MNLIEIAFWLKKTPLFSSLTLDGLFSFAPHFEVVTYKKGATLFSPGLEATRLFFIMEGEVEITDKKGASLTTLFPPDFFGEEALFSKNKRGYTATTTKESKLLVLMGSHFISIINHCPSVGLSLLSAFAAKVDFRPRS